MRRSILSVHGIPIPDIILLFTFFAAAAPVFSESASGSNPAAASAASAPAAPASTAALPGSFMTFTLDTEPMDGYTIWLPPGWEAGESWPLILSLHSAAEVGGAIEMASTAAAAGAITGGGEACAAAVGERFIVLSPHLKQADYPRAQWYIYPAIIASLIRNAVGTWGADPRRIYVIGYSTGGTGTWGLLSRMPEVFAAAVPICGYTQPVKGLEPIIPDFSVCAGTPIWAIYNVWDQNIPIQHIKTAVEKIEAAGPPPFLRLRHKMTSEGGGADHMIIAEASDTLLGVPRIYSTYQVYFHDHAGSFFHPQIYDWMLSHTNPLSAETISAALSEQASR